MVMKLHFQLLSYLKLVSVFNNDVLEILICRPKFKHAFIAPPTVEYRDDSCSVLANGSIFLGGWLCVQFSVGKWFSW